MRLLCSKYISSNGQSPQTFPLFGVQLEGSYSEAVIPLFTSCSLTFILAFLHILIGETPGNVLLLASAGLAVCSAQWPADPTGTMPILIPEEFLLLRSKMTRECDV